MLFQHSVCHVISKGDGKVCIELLSNTLDFTRVGSEKIALLHAAKVALLAELPNFDCTGRTSPNVVRLCVLVCHACISY